MLEKLRLNGFCRTLISLSLGLAFYSPAFCLNEPADASRNESVQTKLADKNQAATADAKQTEDAANSQSNEKDRSLKTSKDDTKDDTKQKSKKRGAHSRVSLSKYWEEDGKNYNLACEIGSRFNKISETELELLQGVFLIESESDCKIRLRMSEVELPEKSMILVRQAPGEERVYCLLENATVRCLDRQISLRYGEEYLLVDHKPRADELAGDYEVGIRQLRAFDLSDMRKLMVMEFSLIQAMEREPLLTQIVHSKHRHDCALRNRLLKLAAILNQVTNQHGPYLGY